MNDEVLVWLSGVVICLEQGAHCLHMVQANLIPVQLNFPVAKKCLGV